MRRVRIFLEMIKFEHTIFALPFAYLGMALAARGWPGWGLFLWITVAMFSARTLAMSVNRVADRHLDARNPRTAGRALPRGLLTPSQVWFAAGASLVVFLLAAWQINDFVLRLAPLALVALVGYSYTKRFTWLSHWVLGVTDGAAAAGAWAAVRASLADPIPWLLWAAVATWIAGFDLIYACQDVDFDRAEGLQAVPARFGVATALRWARVNHALTALLLAAVGWLAGLSWPFWGGWVAAGVLLAWENSLVRPDDLSRLNVAFFNVNGYISVLVLVATVLAL